MAAVTVDGVRAAREKAQRLAAQQRVEAAAACVQGAVPVGSPWSDLDWLGADDALGHVLVPVRPGELAPPPP